MKLELEPTWQRLLSDELESEHFSSLQVFLQKERELETVYPPGQEVFNAFYHTPVDSVKVVLLGQDPYHGADQAHGLCFSVNDGIRIPPSLRNMFKELNADLGIAPASSGDLTKWADQGVLLLNATLTVQKGKAGSHQKKGWEHFTDEVIRKLSQERKNLVFLLWGRFAQNKSSLIDPHNGHLILKTAHPSPLSARTGFFGCGHFSKTNSFLQQIGTEPIDWNLNTQ